MEHYVTLFDSLFLPQGLALHASLERHAGIYKLWVLCVDEITYNVLLRLSLANVQLLRLEEFETDELKRVKNSRTSAEYCWTLTPFVPRFVFESDNTTARVTYLDADMWFRKSPHPVFHELEKAGKHVLITDHGYAPEYDQTAVSGQYCVQFMTFYREHGEIVRRWWQERCVEWCYGRLENGKFGDQKYLDDWTERFSEQVHVLQHQEWMLAPWNAIRFPYNGAICYHFHGLRLSSKSSAVLGSYCLPVPTVNHIYVPYLQDIKNAITALEGVGHSILLEQKFSPQVKWRYFIQKIKVLRAFSWRYAPEKSIEF